MLLQERLLVAAKNSRSLYKALAGLRQGEFDGTVDLLKDIGNDQFAAWIRDKQLKYKVDSIQAESLKEVEEHLKGDLDSKRFEHIYRTALATFNAGYSFEALYDAHPNGGPVAKTWPGQVAHPFGEPDEEAERLHDAILRATTAAFIRQIKDLKGYDAWLFNRVRRLESSSDESRVLLDTLLGKEKREDLEFEEAYRAYLCRCLDKVELFVEHPDVEDADQEQRLSVAYVSLQLGKGRSEAVTAPPVPADLVLASLQPEFQRLLLLGKAGSGKTTLLRWCGLQAAQGDLTPRVVAQKDDPIQGEASPALTKSIWRGKVPFFLRLRDYKDGAFPCPSEYTKRIMTHFEPPSGWAQRILGAGRALLLIDGLDELRPGIREKGLKWIEALVADCHEKTILIVTSRPQAIAGDTLKEQGFADYEVRDLTAEGQLDFIEHWHDAVHDRLGQRPDKRAALEERKQRLLREWRANPSLVVLAANPLLAALICALNRVNREALPKSLYDLCDSAARMLLWGRDKLQDTAWQAFPVGYAALSYEQRLLVVRNVAYSYVSHGEATMGERAVLDEIANTLYINEGPDCDTSEEVLQGIIERSGLLRRCGENELEFVHNSIRDFLAALRYVERGEFQSLARHGERDDLERWEPVLAFSSASIARPSFGAELVNELLKRGSNELPLLPERQLLALRLASHVRYPLPPDLAASLKTIQDSYLPLTSLARVRALAAAGAIAVPYLGPDSSHPVEIATECVKALATINDGSARLALDRYLSSAQDGAILETVAEAIGYKAFVHQRNILELPSVLNLVTSHHNGSHPVLPYVTDLSPIAKLVGLNTLDLSETSVSDLSPLARLRSLEFLSLSYTKVSNLIQMGRMPALKTLFLYRTAVSRAQVKEFQAVHPNCQVYVRW
jgi:quinol monooxygenase YgiN